MKSKTNKKLTPKISTRVWRPILDKLDQKMAAACLRRDAYLNKVLDVELDQLDKEISLANSDAARSFVSGQLDLMPDRKLVSLTLRPDLAERLNDICDRKLIVRDSFFNRLFLLLSASPNVIDRLLGLDDGWRLELLKVYKQETFFVNTFYPITDDIDPFWAIRDWMTDPSGTATAQGDGIYSVFLDNNVFKDIDLTGMNCYVPDRRIPDHPEERKYRKQLDDLLVL